MGTIRRLTRNFQAAIVLPACSDTRRQIKIFAIIRRKQAAGVDRSTEAAQKTRPAENLTPIVPISAIQY
jgi:hypothetical protein